MNYYLVAMGGEDPDAMYTSTEEIVKYWDTVVCFRDEPFPHKSASEKRARVFVSAHTPEKAYEPESLSRRATE